MNSGVYLMAPLYEEAGGIRPVLGQLRLLEVFEGIDTTAAVLQTRRKKHSLLINGKPDASTATDLAPQSLFSQIPLLLHDSPKNALVIGLGSGITLGNTTLHPLEEIVCVEISSEVVAASKYFSNQNFQPLQDPRVSLFVEDGRNFLLVSQKSYDVIISAPSNPWQAGNANLFTADYFELARTRLNEGGVYCQWLPFYDLRPDVFRTAMRTFTTQFSHILAFSVAGDMFLVGSDDPLAFDYTRLANLFSRDPFQSLFSSIGLSSPADLMAKVYLFSEKQLAELSHGYPLNTDNHPILEFSARYLLGKSSRGPYVEENYKTLQKAKREATSPLPLSFARLSPESKTVIFRRLYNVFSAQGQPHRAADFKARLGQLSTQAN